MSIGIYRHTRRRIARWMVAVLLLVQGLTSAYACPALALSLSPRPAAAMPNCHDSLPAEMDSSQPALCKAHCSSDTQATAQAEPDDWPPAALAAGCVALPPAAVQAGRCAAAPGAWPGEPPIYLLQRVLRN